MVTVTSNSGIGVIKKSIRENGERFTCSEYFWLSSKMAGSEKVHFSTKKPTIIVKAWGLPEILQLP